MINFNIQDLRNFAEKYVAAEPDRIGTEGFWQKPLLVSAPIDGRFDSCQRWHFMSTYIHMICCRPPDHCLSSLYRLNASL